MTTLRESLARLAEDAPSALPESGLWERGRRYGRGTTCGHGRDRAGRGPGARRHRRRDLARGPDARAGAREPDAGPAGPDLVAQPVAGRHRRRGTLGQLAALLPASRGGGARLSHLGLVGISAVSGDYRFLDLPDAAYEFSVADAALAPDGRHVAYWLTGTPSGSPNPGPAQDPIVGVGIYDTTSGEVATYRPEVEHGLFPQTLAWADATHLVVDAGQITEGVGAEGPGNFSANGMGARVWVLGEPGPRPAGLRRAPRGPSTRWAPDSCRGPGGTNLVATSADDPRTRTTGSGRRGTRGCVVSRAVDATATASPHGPGCRPDALLRRTGRDGGLGAPPARLVRLRGQRRHREVVGWTDPQHVVALRESVTGATGMEVVRIAVPSGADEVLIRSTALEGRNAQFATDLLG